MRVSFSGLLDYSKGMIAKVLEYVKKYRMIEEGDTIAAGVSGGADSVCLLFVMLHLQKIIPFRLAVVHVNHGIRQEAGRDADYVRELCEDKGLPFYLTEADVPEYAASCGMSSEEAGREIRYRALREALEREGAGVRGRIAVAHNGNDRAETMLFHLFRGTGLTGMSGIRPVSGNIIRPLLCVEREEIEKWLGERDIDYCRDCTNDQDLYTRNRIRHHILPFARNQVCQGAVANMNRAADDLLAAEGFVAGRVEEACGRCAAFEEGERRRAVISIPDFLGEDPYLQGRILLSCLEKAGEGRRDIGAAHIQGILKLLGTNGSGQLHLPHGFIAYKNYDTCEIRRKEEAAETGQRAPGPGEYPVTGEGVFGIPGLGQVETRVFPCEKSLNIPKKTYTKWFDYDKITESMVFRTRRPGDYLTVNRNMGRKSLQDYLVNEKVPRNMRDLLYVLAEGSHIVWIPGYRISEYYKVSEDTLNILQIKIRETDA